MAAAKAIAARNHASASRGTPGSAGEREAGERREGDPQEKAEASGSLAEQGVRGDAEEEADGEDGAGEGSVVGHAEYFIWTSGLPQGPRE